MALLDLRNVKIHFPIKGGVLRKTIGHTKAVDGVSISIEEGTTYGLVGESGSGKSTTGRGIIGLNEISGGKIEFNGYDITKGRKEYDYRKDIQMIFQDPYSSLNSKKRVVDIIAEPLRNFSKMTKEQERFAVVELLEKVGLSEDNLYKYPHEFSGGQRQRIGIARAIALNPKLIIADEPVSALDVSVQAQVLNFMQKIQRELNLSYLFISHDLGIIQHVCDKIGIMYKGRLVEEGTPQDIFRNPQHIYTQRLVSAIPDIDPEQRNAKRELRLRINQTYQNDLNDYFDQEGLAFPLRPISETHYAALPEKG